jgi:hypothetical protein
MEHKMLILMLLGVVALVLVLVFMLVHSSLRYLVFIATNHSPTPLCITVISTEALGVW